MKKVLKIVVLIGVSLGLLFLGYKLFWPSGQGKPGQGIKGKGTGAESEEVPLLVKVLPAQKGDLPLRLSITAVTDSREKAVVRCEVEGVVVEMARREGSRFNKGEPVVRLDSRERELALREAEARRLEAYSKFLSQYKVTIEKLPTTEEQLELEKSKKEYEDILSQFKEGEISLNVLKEKESALLEAMIEHGLLQDEVNRVVSQLTQTEIELDRARLNLERTIIRAPFPGIISEIKVSIGEKVATGTELFRMVNLQSVFLKGYILETEMGKIKTGQQARIRFLSSPDKPVYGRVTSISPEVDTEKKTGTLYIDFPNPGDIRAGLDAEIDIEYAVVANVIKVPRQAVVVRSGRPLVFVVQNDMAVWRYIEIGAMNEEEAEVKTNVAPGDLVVVEGHLTLAHQAKVRIIE